MGAQGTERSRDGNGRVASRPRTSRAARSRAAAPPDVILLAATDAAPEEARMWLRGRLEWADGPLEDAQLLVSELVTNCLRHAGLAPTDRIAISVRRPPPALRVVVCDPGRGFVPPEDPRLPPPSQATGRGLYIVSRLSDRWGVSCGDRTCVWFEIDGPRRLERYH